MSSFDSPQCCGHVLVPGWRCGPGPVMGDVLLFGACSEPPTPFPSSLPHRDRATTFIGAWLVARHPEGLLRSQLQPLPLLPAGKCHKVEQGHLHFCPSFLILLFLFLCASTSLIAELAVGLWGIITLFSLNARILSAADLGTVKFFFINVLSLTRRISHVFLQELQQILFESTRFHMFRV